MSLVENSSLCELSNAKTHECWSQQKTTNKTNIEQNTLSCVVNKFKREKLGSGFRKPAKGQESSFSLEFFGDELVPSMRIST